MGDHYGDESQSASDQDDLVGNTDYDDEFTDFDDVQLNYCKHSQDNKSTIEQNEYYDDQSRQHLLDHNDPDNYTKLILFGAAIALFVTAFALLITYSLYIEQLSIVTSQNNAYGAMIYLVLMVNLGLMACASTLSIVFKWNINILKPPIEWRRLFTISSCSAVAGTVCIVCSYQRVPCHLQDPLKGAALVFSLVFYFFLCKKVMGLQRLFSATISIVGLFISVDYGLCDEFRCRGHNITVITSSSSSSLISHSLSNVSKSIEWQGHAFWTFIYLAGIALWTLHLSLLEGYIHTTPTVTTKNNDELLSTVSRIVSNTESIPNERPIVRRHKPNVVQFTLWIHIISIGVTAFFGIVDIFPAHGTIGSVSSFWKTTGNTFLCHLNIESDVPERKSHQETLEFLSNLTPGSYLYNQTVQKLRRTKRNDNLNSNNDINIIVMNTTNKSSLNINRTMHLNKNHMKINETLTSTASLLMQTTSPPQTTTTTTTSMLMSTTAHKINSNKYWKKAKNHTIKFHQNHKHKIVINSHNRTPIKISTLVLNTIDEKSHCNKLSQNGLLMIIVYIGFTFALYNFLLMSESAVFTIAVMSSALPVSGIFWSLFELTINRTATITWSPKITGELICSLLGTPIVLLGLALLFHAHFNIVRFKLPLPQKRLYTSLSSTRA